MRHAVITLAAILICAGAQAAEMSGYAVDVLVGGTPRAEYSRGGTVYVEALRGREFAIRLTNPTPLRVAVALSVDGLNTIDARHSDPWSARKWVLEPYESTVISGWQVNDRSARRFFFTGERRSYGAALGETENLGVIEAVYYVERRSTLTGPYAPWSEAVPEPPRAMSRHEGAQSAPPPAMAPAPSAGGGALSDDYAATGMGGRTRHEVERVDIDLEPHPAASLRIRYGFRPELVKLGILLDGPSPLDRRERARGFAGYCPEP